MINFCTLFDSFYLDKAIALYNSLEQVSKAFHLYTFCFDEKSYEIIKSLNWNNVTVLSNKEIEDEGLLKIKKQRSKAEYCWTCTPIIIEYVLKNYPVTSCTYIDADLYFFDDPQIIIDEIEKGMGDISIVEHRFFKDKNYSKKIYKAGKYCVEFNYFNQSENAWEALTWWKNKCLEWCFYKLEPERMGDQKYLEKFPVLFKNVHEIQCLGAGVAPWNLAQYKLSDASEKIVLQDKHTGVNFKLIFYHFQNLRYLSNDVVNIKSQTHNKLLKQKIYLPYLKELRDAEIILKQRYGITLERKKKYSNNWFNTILQKYIVAFKVTSITDIIYLNKL